MNTSCELRWQSHAGNQRMDVEHSNPLKLGDQIYVDYRKIATTDPRLSPNEELPAMGYIAAMGTPYNSNNPILEVTNTEQLRKHRDTPNQSGADIYQPLTDAQRQRPLSTIPEYNQIHKYDQRILNLREQPPWINDYIYSTNAVLTFNVIGGSDFQDTAIYHDNHLEIGQLIYSDNQGRLTTKSSNYPIATIIEISENSRHARVRINETYIATHTPQGLTITEAPNIQEPLTTREPVGTRNFQTLCSICGASDCNHLNPAFNFNQATYRITNRSSGPIQFPCRTMSNGKQTSQLYLSANATIDVIPVGASDIITLQSIDNLIVQKLDDSSVNPESTQAMIIIQSLSNRPVKLYLGDRPSILSPNQTISASLAILSPAELTSLEILKNLGNITVTSIPAQPATSISPSDEVSFNKFQAILNSDDSDDD